MTAPLSHRGDPESAAGEPGGPIRLRTRTPARDFPQAWSPVAASSRRLTGAIEPHAHDFLKLAVVAGGTGRHRTSGGTATARPGSVFVLRPGTWHCYVDCDDLLVGHCCVSDAALRGEFAFLRGLPEVRRLLWTAPMVAGRRGVLATSVPPDVAGTAFDHLMALRDELAAGCRSRALLASAVLRVVGTLAEGADTGSGPGGDELPPAVSRTVRLLEVEPARAWTLAELAAEAGLAPTYLSRLFRRHVALSPMAYLARQRVERAAVLLARTDLTVAEVGAAVGWSDPSYFTRRFRELVGMTPRAHRLRSRDPVSRARPTAGPPVRATPARGRSTPPAVPAH